MAEERKQKLYAYVDESGQDTRGQIFLVSVVVAGENREVLRRKLREIEQSSGKQTNKWVRTRPARREAYIQSPLQAREFTGHVYYAQYHGTRPYVDLMIFSTGKALHTHTPDPLSATIVVDGLGRPERHRFAAGQHRGETHDATTV